VKGLVPDTRAKVWPDAWNRIFEHPLIGHGPNYSSLSGTHYYAWPHCLYLYVANNVGFIGLAVFLWLLWTFFRMSRPTTDDLRGGDYVRSYMIVAHVQMLVFMVDQIKIEYLRNENYQFQVWMMFALITAGYQVARAAEGPGRSAAVPQRQSVRR
jgi:O-antigen ligase